MEIGRVRVMSNSIITGRHTLINAFYALSIVLFCIGLDSGQGKGPKYRRLDVKFLFVTNLALETMRLSVKNRN